MAIGYARCRAPRQNSGVFWSPGYPGNEMKSAQLIYCIVCDDVRIEMGNKLSLMGVFENIFLPAFPSMLLKFAVVNHWEGVGQYETQVKIVNPERREVVVSVPSTFMIESQGYADNVTFFTNVSFDRPG